MPSSDIVLSDKEMILLRGWPGLALSLCACMATTAALSGCATATSRQIPASHAMSSGQTRTSAARGHSNSGDQTPAPRGIEGTPAHRGTAGSPWPTGGQTPTPNTERSSSTSTAAAFVSTGSSECPTAGVGGDPVLPPCPDQGPSGDQPTPSLTGPGSPTISPPQPSADTPPSANPPPADPPSAPAPSPTVTGGSGQ